MLPSSGITPLLKRCTRNLQGLATFSACTINTIACFVPILALALLKLAIPATAVRRVVSSWIMSIGDAWVGINARIFALRNHTEWNVRGLDGLSTGKWYLVIANHQTWVDIVALQTIFNRRIPFLKFFIKQELIWFPFLGIAWWAMDMPFMKRYSKSYLAKHPDKKGKDMDATRKACMKFRDAPTSVINFVEGTRFTPEKRRQRRSKFEYLLPPRAGGIALALTSMGKMFDAILDVTIFYPRGVVNFWDMMCGDFRRIVVDVRVRPVESWLYSGDYENDREYRTRFHRWLTDVWKDKDRRLAALRAESVAD